MSNTFSPVVGGGIKRAVTATNGSTALSTSGNFNAIRVHNLAGSNKAFFRIGSGTQTAVVDTDLCLGAGDSIILRVPRSQTDYEIGAICDATETATLYVSVGNF